MMSAQSPLGARASRPSPVAFDSLEIPRDDRGRRDARGPRG
jgi:hypothetical protein